MSTLPGNSTQGPPFCRSNVLGLICDLSPGHEQDHHLVAGHCPTHGRPHSRVPDPRTHFPLCGTCGLALLPKHWVDRHPGAGS